MADTLRIGLLGAARITPKAVCDPAHVIPRVRLEGVAARDKRRAAEFAELHRVHQVFDSYEPLLESPDIDLIYNPLPINRHAEWTIRALEAGKHVLCEKPFAMNAGEAKEMQAAAGKAGKRLIEAFHYRYHPAFQQCLDWIEAGRIGTVREIEADFCVEIRDSDDEIRQLPETGGGAMMDLGCYPLSWTLQALGEAPISVEAEATLTRRGVDESLTATLGFESGAVAKLSTSMAPGTPFKAAMTIAGSKGRIHFEKPIFPHRGGHLRLETENGGHEEATISPISTYTWQLAAVLDALHTDTPLPTEGAVIQTQQTQLDAIYEAAGLRHLRDR
ncbi:Gfo/Idh/MocA family protein [Henriciella aquimarina]|uniref:Gfo/Idh/MocA family protein n=1 Tax=Henriciella aquimarina TaxID=545261 RepID=UPI000A011EFC|nr:Gfo/Idh/MocA family oxidoreductase [Henriciella aquimarina]